MNTAPVPDVAKHQAGLRFPDSVTNAIRLFWLHFADKCNRSALAMWSHSGNTRRSEKARLGKVSEKELLI